MNYKKILLMLILCLTYFNVNTVWADDIEKDLAKAEKVYNFNKNDVEVKNGDLLKYLKDKKIINLCTLDNETCKYQANKDKATKKSKSKGCYAVCAAKIDIKELYNASCKKTSSAYGEICFEMSKSGRWGSTRNYWENKKTEYLNSPDFNTTLVRVMYNNGIKISDSLWIDANMNGSQECSSNYIAGQGSQQVGKDYCTALSVSDLEYMTDFQVAFLKKGIVGVAYSNILEPNGLCNNAKGTLDEMCKYGKSKEAQDAKEVDSTEAQITDDLTKEIFKGNAKYQKYYLPSLISGKENKLTCEEILGNEIIDIIQSIVNIVKVAVPILLIGLGVLDFGKAAISFDEAAMKKAQGKFIKRLIIGISFFLIPVVIDEVLLKIAHSVWGDVIGTGICGIKF